MLLTRILLVEAGSFLAYRKKEGISFFKDEYTLEAE